MHKTNNNTNNLVLDLSVTSIDLVSQKRAKALNNLGIYTIRDLLHHYPYRYIDLTNISSIEDAVSGNIYTVAGFVHNIELKEPRPGLQIVEITLVDNNCSLIVSIFRQPWLTKTIKKNYIIAVAGQMEFSFGFKRMTNPFIEILDRSCTFDVRDVTSITKSSYLDNKLRSFASIIPVHNTTSQISTAWFRRIVKNALSMCKSIQNFVPKDLCSRYKLLDYYDALNKIHFPRYLKDIELAKRTLKYFEILILQVYMRKSYAQVAYNKHAVEHVIDGTQLNKVVSGLDFELTQDQMSAFGQISSLMSLDKPCNHLLFGDVGTGKTVIAAMCMAIAVDSGYQAMVMVPTEILATQHLSCFIKLYKNTDIKIEMLSRSTSAKEAKRLYESFCDGSLDILIGTHALLNTKVNAKHCSFIVIDEQHRFGVGQKKELIKKGNFRVKDKEFCADVMYMSATPIPRSLAMTIYGDMTYSYMKETPASRTKRTTTVLYRENTKAAYEAAYDALEIGKQVFIVCPLVGIDTKDRNKRSSRYLNENLDDDKYNTNYSVVSIDSEDDYKFDNVRAAKKHAQILQNTVFTNYEVGLLHGSMTATEKNDVMDKFSKNQIQVLVCTTVVEVGIDVQSASVMIVEDADRFGLSQLHQLRGRVGRDGNPANIFLISNSKNKQSLERLSLLEKFDDGIKLSEYDLSMRLEGDILGVKQHGKSILKLISPQKDRAIIKTAYIDAKQIIEDDPTLSKESNKLLDYEISRTFERNLS